MNQYCGTTQMASQTNVQQTKPTLRKTPLGHRCITSMSGLG